MAFNDNEVLTVSSTPITLTSSKITTGFPIGVTISVETAPIRLTLTGVAPNNTTKNGIVLAAGTVFQITGKRDMTNLKMIKSGGTDASVSVLYEQEG